MAKFFFSVVTFLTVLIGIKCTSTNTCIEENPCLCKISENSEINLSSLLKKDQQFLEVSSSASTETSIYYFFLGCKDKPFDPKLPKLNATGQPGSLFKWSYNVTDNTKSTLKLIGSAKDIKFGLLPNSKHYQIVYAKDKSNSSSSPSIRLVCADFESTALAIENSETDQLELFSHSVCVITHNHGLSTGSILLILLFVFAGVYFIVGALILYFIRGARGVEIIPNIDFWRGLPGLVKDGIIFLFSGCRPTYVSTAETYDRI